MLDVLLEAGADINPEAAGGPADLASLTGVDPGLAQYASSACAVVDVHAASRLGMLDRLKKLARADPALVHARAVTAKRRFICQHA
jgi:hypothetical protein